MVDSREGPLAPTAPETGWCERSTGTVSHQPELRIYLVRIYIYSASVLDERRELRERGLMAFFAVSTTTRVPQRGLCFQRRRACLSGLNFVSRTGLRGFCG